MASRSCSLCTDCLFVSVTPEAFERARGTNAPPYRPSSMARLQEAEAAVEALGCHVVPQYFDREVVYSKDACDCCGAPRWGERYRFEVTEYGDEELRLAGVGVDELLSMQA